MASSLRLGIFGGTFDPVHWGHLIIAEQALTQFNLDRILWVPAQHPPHKTACPPTTYSHRVEMLQLAIADHPRFQLCETSTPAQTPSYAIYSLQWLQTIYPSAQWFWIIGEDALHRVSHWYRHQDLAAQCEWLVAPRSETELNPVQELSKPTAVLQIPPYIRWRRLDTPRIGLSSHQIRQRSAQGSSIRYLVSVEVETYIREHHLYA